MIGRERERGGGLLGGEGYAVESRDGDGNGERQEDLHSVKRVSVLLKDHHMHTWSPAIHSWQIQGP